jgi:hypothetical protein
MRSVKMDEKNTRIISTSEEFKIFSDPYRMEIINTYRSKDRALTATECANLMGEIPSKVHYHIKKLLKIDILTLDHVKVINGINARYYKLPKANFLIRLEDEKQQKMYSSLNKVESVAVNMIDTFKSNYIKTAQKAIDDKITDETEVGNVGTTRLYLSKDDYKKLINDIEKLLEKYTLDDDESKKKYDFLGGIARKIK